MELYTFSKLNKHYGYLLKEIEPIAVYYSNDMTNMDEDHLPIMSMDGYLQTYTKLNIFNNKIIIDLEYIYEIEQIVIQHLTEIHQLGK